MADVILDLDQFIRREQPFWHELEQTIERLADGEKLDGLAAVRRFYYLYERTCSDLAKVQSLVAEPDLRQYLERLVGQAYARLHHRRDRRVRFQPITWLASTFPATFRKHIIAFWLALGFSLLGAATGTVVMMKDPDQKWMLVPPQFAHLHQSPSERVFEEERLAEQRTRQIGEVAPAFSSQLMTHNTKVALTTMAVGFLWGILTFVLLFYNGVILGFVSYDYIADGQGTFLTAWLLPHGVPELTAIFIGGQAGLVLARAVIGWGTGLRLRQRLRLVRDDLATLAGGLAVMLVWAGLVEAFLSQYHGPSLYTWKIGFGLLEIGLLVAFLSLCGRQPRPHS